MSHLVARLVNSAEQRVARFWRRLRTNYDWRRRHATVLRLHSDYGRPCLKNVEREHLALWRQLRRRVRLQTLRICYGISGRADPRIVPEEIFAAEIEPSINPYEICRFQANKSVYNRWFPEGIFPVSFLHNVDGRYYNHEYEPLSSDSLRAVVRDLPYPVVMKPSMGSQGRDVWFPRTAEELEEAMQKRRNFVIQEKIRQHAFFDRFHRASLNTIRVCAYRSFRTNDVHVLSMAMRMGVGGSLDNLSAGGIVCHIGEEGTFNDFALDKYGAKFPAHPDTHVTFADEPALPGLNELRALICRVTEGVFLARLVSYDVCMDAEGTWRIIEVNLGHQTIRFAQYAGQPFFGEFTDEVIEKTLRMRA
jgi:hypothetical protein